MRVLGVETGQQLLHWSWTITPSKIPGRAGLVISAMPVDRVAPKGHPGRMGIRPVRRRYS
jgi:hypothetical protein